MEEVEKKALHVHFMNPSIVAQGSSLLLEEG